MRQWEWREVFKGSRVQEFKKFKFTIPDTTFTKFE
jgi:hypothetical protein